MAQYISCYIKLEKNRFHASLGYKLKLSVDKQNSQTKPKPQTKPPTQHKIRLERRLNKEIG